MRPRSRGQRSQGTLLGAVIGLVVILAVVGLLVASPRHRHFYSRLLGGASPPSPSVAAPPPVAPAPPPRPAPPPTVSDRPQGYATPIVPETAPRPSPPPPAPSAQPSDDAARAKEPRPKRPVVLPPRGGPGERVEVKILDDLLVRLPLAGPPAGWELKEFAGRSQVEVVRDGGHIAFRLSSDQASFALYRDAALDVKEFPILTWSWKVTKLPLGGDVRERASDDQAAQVYVIFPRWPFPRINSDVLGYVWDTRAPAGLQLTSPQSGNVKLTVLESGTERLGQWISEQRNVYQDYVDLFGKEPPQAGKVAIMIDSNDTRSQAEAFFGELVFQRTPLGAALKH